MNNPSNQSGQHNPNKTTEQKREARPSDKSSQKPGSANVRPGSTPQNQNR